MLAYLANLHGLHVWHGGRGKIGHTLKVKGKNQSFFFFEVAILQRSIYQFGFLHKMSCFLRDSHMIILIKLVA